jgi:hypothetical protein
MATMHVGIDDFFAEGSLGISVKSESDDGLSISLDGYSTKTSEDGSDDAIIFLELNDGRPILYVWADINSEEPTHTINLSGANINKRMSDGH